MNIAQYIGRPYQVPENDCWSLVREFTKNEMGITLPEYLYSFTDNEADAARIIQDEYDHHLGEHWYRVAKPAVGDLVLFRIFGAVAHCGVVVDAATGDFLHTLRGRNSALENINDANWAHRVFGFFRYQP